jgi:hypothetical protein
MQLNQGRSIPGDRYNFMVILRMRIVDLEQFKPQKNNALLLDGESETIY